MQSLQQECDLIIGINLIPIKPLPVEEIQSLFSIGMRVFDMQVAHNSRTNFPQCDIVIEPEKLNEIGIFNFSAHKEIYQIGYNVAQENIKKNNLFLRLNQKEERFI